jgi:hypothetical protein
MRAKRVLESLTPVIGFVYAVSATIAVPRLPDLCSGFE